MTKNILLTIQGLQFEDDAAEEELDQIQTICPGEYYYRNGAHFILYEEQEEDYPEPVKNMIKLRDKEFSITKKGLYNVQMVFSEGKKSMADYMTPFGSILVAMDTTKVEVEETQEKIRIHIQYGLEVNYQYIADCEITVQVDARA